MSHSKPPRATPKASTQASPEEKLREPSMIAESAGHHDRHHGHLTLACHRGPSTRSQCPNYIQRYIPFLFRSTHSGSTHNGRVDHDPIFWVEGEHHTIRIGVRPCSAGPSRRSL